MSTHAPNPTSRAAWIVVAAILGVTAVATVIVVRLSPVAGTRGAASLPADRSSPDPRPVPGVRVMIGAEGESIERILARASFALDADETLSGRLSERLGSYRIETRITPSGARSASFGAMISGASLRILAGGEVIATHDRASAEITEIWSGEVPVPSGGMDVTFELSVGEGPVSFRPMWKPDSALAAHPLPARDADWFRRESVDQGLALVQLLNCAACHVPGNEGLRDLLAAAPAPILDGAGARLRPEWVEAWITDPQSRKRGTRMPSTLTSETSSGTAIDLTQFLVARTGAIDDESSEADADLAATGLVAYHTIGCVACHGPLHEPNGAALVVKPQRTTYASLGAPGRKTTAEQLASFLRDPLRTHPAGLMPDLQLTDLESRAIAAYLVGLDPVQLQAPLKPDPQRAERGLAAFSSMGCAACHVLHGDNGPIASTLAAPPFESIASAPESGCLSEAPIHAGVRYELTNRDRRSIRAYLSAVADDRGGRQPIDELRAAIRRLDCLACHTLDGSGGPEGAIRRYFGTVVAVDLGDEGRLPPDLTDVGARLTADWMRGVLIDGTRARPYMATRMPKFGEGAVGHLPRMLQAAAGWTGEVHAPPSFEGALASVGRELVGVAGLNCISCHPIAGRESTGAPGPDLARMTERLTFEYFDRWLHDPRAIRADTRMPTFFTGGESVAIGYLDADPRRQIDALWMYLSLGDTAPLPDGLPQAGGYELRVTEEPIVFRTFMAGAGTRAIACGYPQQVHCAFDAERCRLAFTWEGMFIDAAGAWAGRAGQQTNPLTPPGWSAPEGPSFVVGPTPPEDWRASFDHLRFRGYRFNARREPTFLYDLAVGEATIRVEEQPLPAKVKDGPGLERRIHLKGPAGTIVWFNLGASARMSGGTADPAREDGLVPVQLDETGVAHFIVEVWW